MKVVTVIGLTLMLFLGAAKAHAHNHQRICGLGGKRSADIKMARCLTKQSGIRVNTSYAISILECEGANQYQGGAPYYGFWQLTKDEFRAFWHQGPEWVKDEFRKHDYGIFSARGQTLAVYSHAQRYGFGWSSCA